MNGTIKQVVAEFLARIETANIDNIDVASADDATKHIVDEFLKRIETFGTVRSGSGKSTNGRERAIAVSAGPPLHLDFPAIG